MWLKVICVLNNTRNMIQRGSKIVMEDLLECGDSMQECIESIRDLKSYNNEHEYLSKMSNLTSRVERSRIRAELMASAGVITGNVVLKLGIVSVILIGSYLIMKGQVSIYTLLIFLIASASIYAPVENGMMFLSEILMMDIKIERSKEIESQVIPEGLKDYSLESYDIKFKDVNFNYDELKDVLSNISFTALQGEMTALVGPSG